MTESQPIQEECFDVLDIDGNPTGISKPRSQVHRDGDWHSCVHVWFMNSKKQQLLLQKRLETKDSWPGFLDISVAGHLSAGDTRDGAAIREVEEEIGITLTLSQLQYRGQMKQQHVLKNGTFIDNEHAYIYVVESNHDVSEFTLQESEVESVEWIPIQKWIDIQSNDPKSQGYVPIMDFDSYKKLLFPNIK